MKLTINVTELKKMTDELMADGIEFAEVAVVEGQQIDKKVVPTSMSFNAYDGDGGRMDYGEIIGVNVSPSYKTE